MRNLLGAVLSLATAAFLFRAWALRRHVLASVGAAELARRRAAALADPRSLSAFGEIARPLVLLGLGWLALKSTLVYLMLDGARVLSWFDLVAFVALLAAYGVWFSTRAAYWVPDQVASPEAAPGDARSSAEPTAGAVAGWPTTAPPETTLPLCDGAEGRSSRRAA
jgi:hypothetical protein